MIPGRGGDSSRKQGAENVLSQIFSSSLVGGLPLIVDYLLLGGETLVKGPILDEPRNTVVSE